MMTDRIAPALTAEEWATRTAQRPPNTREEHIRLRAINGRVSLTESYSDETGEAYDCNDLGVDPDGLPAMIALANAALPDDDPRKITRDTVALIRQVAQASAENYRVYKLGNEEEREIVERLFAIADALESYLPPE